MKHKAIKKETCEVLVIGSGGAGLRTAIELFDKGVNVLVVGKCKRRDAHTVMATGGINAALGNMDKEDSWQLHAADTIIDGGDINNPIAVKLLCKNAPYAVKELVNWGAKFHREKNGSLTQRFFGAATYRRACFAGDHTGKEILNVLIDQVLKRKIRLKSEVYIFALLTNKGKVNGAIGLDIKNGKLVIFHCKIIVLCTGGHSRMFKRSSSRFWENNGDGIALAYDLGAKFMDMEMFQFHPTGMVFPEKAAGTLVTEAVRGEGGILTNVKGERFMKKYDPKRLELSARDIVSRAVYNEIKQGRGTKHNGVWLDISHKTKKYIIKRLPRMYKRFKDSGIDISREKMEVAPTAHYSMGGIFVNHKTGKTSVNGLYAIGEVTAGVHGGNRLGGNSLAEIIVFGRLTGKNIAKEIKKAKLIKLNKKLMEEKKRKLLDMLKITNGEDPIKIKKQIQELMWKYAWVVRNAKDMKNGLKELQKYKKIKLKIGKTMKNNEKLIAALDVRNMIPTCEIILKSDLYRKESRASHYRSDYTKTLNKWKKNIICQLKEGKIKITTEQVSEIPKDIMKIMKKRKELIDSKERHILE